MGHDALMLELFFQMNIWYFLKWSDFSMPFSRQYAALGKAKRDASIPSLRPAAERGSPSLPGNKGESGHSSPTGRRDNQTRAQFQHPLCQQASNSHNEETPKEKQNSPPLVWNYLLC